jgi:hypothetical protein
MRTGNSAIPCHDGCLIQVIPSPSNAKNLPPGNPSGIPVYMRMRNPDVFATLGWFGLGSPIVPVVQPSQSHMRKDVT